MEETIKGVPLVGPSGSIFNAGLRSAGIDRAQHFVGNVFSRQMDEDEIGRAMSNPGTYQMEFERLSRELHQFHPNVIVPLGNTALWAFTGHGGVRDYRGATQLATRICPGAKLLPTYHPQAVQKQWKLLAVFVGDLIKADIEAHKGPDIVYPDVDLLLDPTFDDVEAFLMQCAIAPLVSVDIETGWGQITMVGLSPFPFKDAMAIPFVDFRQPSRSYWKDTATEVEVWKLLEAFMICSVSKLGQNFPYDAFWLWEAMGIPVLNYTEDTRLMHHALYPELEKSLAFMGARYTDLGAWKQWGGAASKEKRDDA